MSLPRTEVAANYLSQPYRPNFLVKTTRLRQLRFKIQKSAVELGTRVRHEFGFGGVEDGNLAFKLCQEQSSAATHQVRHPRRNSAGGRRRWQDLHDAQAILRHE